MFLEVKIVCNRGLPASLRRFCWISSCYLLGCIDVVSHFMSILTWDILLLCLMIPINIIKCLVVEASVPLLLSFQEHLFFARKTSLIFFLVCSLVQHQCLGDAASRGEGVCFMEMVVKVFSSIMDSQDPMIMCCSVIESQTLG